MMVMFRSAACGVLFALLSLTAFSADDTNEPLGDAGILPTAADGRVLNLNFETGDLTDWTATGEAFAQQSQQFVLR